MQFVNFYTQRLRGYGNNVVFCLWVFFSFLVRHVWIIQNKSYLFVTFANDESVVCNTSFFFCCVTTKMIWSAIHVDRRYVLLSVLVHSDQTSRRIRITTFCFLWWWFYFQGFLSFVIALLWCFRLWCLGSRNRSPSTIFQSETLRQRGTGSNGRRHCGEVGRS